MMPASRPDPRLFFDELNNGLLEALFRLSRAEDEISHQLREQNDGRQRMMYALAVNAIPDLSKETLVNLESTDLREFGALAHVRGAFERVWALKLGWGEFAWSLIVRPTAGYCAYYDTPSKVLEDLRLQIADFFNSKIDALERLIPLRRSETEVMALNERLGEVLRHRSEVLARADTLHHIEHAVIAGTYDEFLAGSLQNACAALRQCTQDLILPVTEHDEIIAWALWLPDNLRDWDVSQQAVAA